MTKKSGSRRGHPGRHDRQDPAQQEPPKREPPSEDVGYARPPVHSRFKPGASGNPKGRPKGSKSFSTLLEKALSKRVRATENGKPIVMTRREVIIEKIAIGAMQLDPKAIPIVMAHDARREAAGKIAEDSNEADDLVEAYAAFMREVVIGKKAKA